MPLSPEELEQRLHRTLKASPNRRAPAALTERVLAAVAAQQALPWWKKSYAYWPASVQTGFVVLGVLAMIGLNLANITLGEGVQIGAAWAPVQAALDALAKLQATGSALVQVGERLLPQISPIWVTTIGLGVICLYATFFGLAAATYRVLMPNSRSAA